MRSSIRIPEGWGALDMRDEDVALPQESLRNSIACTPANWRDIYGRAVYRDDHGNEFCIERRAGRPSDGRYACLYIVHPVETEEDDEREPFVHTLDEMEDVYA